MISQGASTLNARTIVEQTRTLPNHSSMVSGRKLATPGGHGVPFNQDNGSIIHASAGRYVVSIFDVVHDNGGTTGMYVGKAKFDFLDRSWNATNGAPDLTGVDNGRDKIDVYQMANSSTTVTALLYQLASSTPMTLSFVHLADTDNAGHAFGFMSAAYLDAVTVVDGYLDQILDAIAADPDLARSTVVIVDDRSRRRQRSLRSRRPKRRGQLHGSVPRLGRRRRGRGRPVRAQPGPGESRNGSASLLGDCAADPYR